MNQATGEDFSVEPTDSRRPFRALLDVGLIRTTTGNRVFGALKVLCFNVVVCVLICCIVCSWFEDDASNPLIPCWFASWNYRELWTEVLISLTVTRDLLVSTKRTSNLMLKSTGTTSTVATSQTTWSCWGKMSRRSCKLTSVLTLRKELKLRASRRCTRRFTQLSEQNPTIRKPRNLLPRNTRGKNK